MKKSNNIISDWLEKYGNSEIDKQVEGEIKYGFDARCTTQFINTSNGGTTAHISYTQCYAPSLSPIVPSNNILYPPLTKTEFITNSAI